MSFLGLGNADTPERIHVYRAEHGVQCPSWAWTPQNAENAETQRTQSYECKTTRVRSDEEIWLNSGNNPFPATESTEEHGIIEFSVDSVGSVGSVANDVVLFQQFHESSAFSASLRSAAPGQLSGTIQPTISFNPTARVMTS